MRVRQLSVSRSAYPPTPHELGFPGQSDPKLPHLEVALLHPWSPLLRCCCGNKLYSVSPTQTGRHFLPDAVRLDCKNMFQNSFREASGLLTIVNQKAVMPVANSSPPMFI